LTGGAVLVVEDLAVRYTGVTPARHVLQGVSLALGPGDCLCVLGPNGSGKSTLLHAIGGTIDAQCDGRVTVGGSLVTGKPQHIRARQIALVHQDPARGTAAHLTLREHCQLTTSIGARAEVAWATVADRLGTLGTRLDPDRLAGELSGGQRQLLTVLLATLSAPGLLLLDEPTSALDTRHQELVLGVVAEFIAAGKGATILVTHDPREALRLGNQLLVLGARGQVHARLSPPQNAALDIAALREILAGATAGAWAAP